MRVNIIARGQEDCGVKSSRVSCYGRGNLSLDRGLVCISSAPRKGYLARAILVFGLSSRLHCYPTVWPHPLDSSKLMQRSTKHITCLPALTLPTQPEVAVRPKYGVFERQRIICAVCIHRRSRFKHCSKI